MVSGSGFSHTHTSTHTSHNTLWKWAHYRWWLLGVIILVCTLCGKLIVRFSIVCRLVYIGRMRQRWTRTEAQIFSAARLMRICSEDAGSQCSTKYTGMCHNAWLQQQSLQACATLSSSLSRHSSLPPIILLLIKLRGSFFPSGSSPSPQLHAFSHPLPRTACPPLACCLSLRHVQPLCT